MARGRSRGRLGPLARRRAPIGRRRGRTRCHWPGAAAGRGQGRLRSMAVRPGRAGRGGGERPPPPPAPLRAAPGPRPRYPPRAHQVLDGRLLQELLRRLELGAVCGSGGGGKEPASVSGSAGPNRPGPPPPPPPRGAPQPGSHPPAPPPHGLFPAAAHALPGPLLQGCAAPAPPGLPTALPSVRPRRRRRPAPYPVKPSSPGW